MKNNNYATPSQPHKFNLVVSAIVKWSLEGIGFGESRTDTTDLELESPIVNVEVKLTGNGSGDVVRINKIEIKGEDEFYTLDFVNQYSVQFFKSIIL